MTLTKIRTFRYGSSHRTVYKLSEPLSDRAFPLRWDMVKIERDGEPHSWLACYESGEVMCYHPPCAADLNKLEAGA